MYLELAGQQVNDYLLELCEINIDKFYSLTNPSRTAEGQ